MQKVGELVERVEEVEERIAGVGRLRAWEFCEGQARVSRLSYNQLFHLLSSHMINLSC